jgi:hypothetical protein
MSSTTADPRTLYVRQGDTFRATFTWEDSAGNPNSLTGYHALFQVLNRVGGTAQLTVSSQDSAEDDGTVTIEPDDTTGVITVRLTAQQTATLTRNCVYTLDIISLTDATEVDNISAGPVVVSLAGS